MEWQSTLNFFFVGDLGSNSELTYIKLTRTTFKNLHTQEEFRPWTQKLHKMSNLIMSTISIHLNYSNDNVEL